MDAEESTDPFIALSDLLSGDENDEVFCGTGYGLTSDETPRYQWVPQPEEYMNVEENMGPCIDLSDLFSGDEVFGGTGDNLSYGLTSDQTPQYQWVPQPEGFNLNPGLMVHDQTLHDQLSPHPEAGEAYSFQCGTGNALSYGLVSDQTLQYQWGPQLEETAGAVNVKNPSQIFPTPKLPRSPQPSPKRLRKREADKKYRDKEKQRTIELKSQVDTLTEENKCLNNKCAGLKKRTKRQKKELERNKRLMTAEMHVLYKELQRMIVLKSQVGTLTEENKRLNNRCARLKKIVKRLKQELDRSPTGA